MTYVQGFVLPVPADKKESYLLSLRSLLFRLSFFVLGPAVGAWIDRAGFHEAIGGTGAFLLALTGLTWWKARTALR